jgi:hypothetical protein
MKSLTITILISIAALLLITGCSDSSTSPESEPDVITEATITLNNSGASAYVAVSVEGSGATATINAENPEITLTTGGRYTIINNAGASSHPLDFRDANGNKLFGQSRDEGSLVNNTDINVVKNNNTISFTLTDELAERLSEYICFFHPGMNGTFRIVEANS